MTNIIEVWKSSLGIFKPKNLKLFLLVSVHTLWMTVKVFVTKAWPIWGSLLVLGCGIGYGIKELIQSFTTYGGEFPLFSFWILGSLLQLVFACFFLSLCVAARPSAQPKDTSYFLYFLKSRWYMIFLIYLCFFVIGLAGLDKVCLPIMVFWILFVCDMSSGAKNTLNAVSQAGTMFIYQLPVCLGVIVVAYLLELALQALLSLGICITPFDSLGAIVVSFVVRTFVQLLFLIGGLIVLFTNLYIKWRHEYPELYEKGPKEISE